MSLKEHSFILAFFSNPTLVFLNAFVDSTDMLNVD